MTEYSSKEPLLTSLSSSLREKSHQVNAPSLGYFAQVKLLTFKNLLITLKNPKNILFLMITPFLLSLFLYGMQELALDNGDFTIEDPADDLLPAFPACSW